MKTHRASRRGTSPFHLPKTSPDPVQPRARNHLAASRLGKTLAAVLAMSLPAAVHGQTEGGGWSMSADAAAGFSLASDGINPASPDSAALWILSTNFLHRYDSPGWGLVLSDSIDLSGIAAAASGTGGTTALPSFAPLITVYEAYARLDMGNWGQLFVGKRRMGLGIGSTFAPGDLVDPRSGFWDQKTGFRGLDFAASLGSDFALRLAMSLDRNFEAWAAGVHAKTAPVSPALAQAYAGALDGASGPADPRLITWAGSTDAQFGSLQLSAAGVYRPDSVERPSLGLSYDLDGLILQGEGAAEFSADGAAAPTKPDWYGTAGLRWMASGDSDSLSVTLDYDYNGRAGLLEHTNYLLPWISYTRNDVLNAYARALIGLDDDSALVSLGLTLYPAQAFDLEFTALFGTGANDAEFATLSNFAPILSPGAGKLSTQVGFDARVHF